jgi:hypothetical protein
MRLIERDRVYRYFAWGLKKLELLTFDYEPCQTLAIKKRVVVSVVLQQLS